VPPHATAAVREGAPLDGAAPIGLAAVRPAAALGWRLALPAAAITGAPIGVSAARFWGAPIPQTAALFLEAFSRWLVHARSPLGSSFSLQG
jgi:hypothetical protein